MKRLIISSLSIFIYFFAQAQYEVIPINSIPTKPIENGFYYSLPKTGIKISITATKTLYHKGLYSDYAEKLLGLSEVIKEDRNQYEISDIEIENFALADPSQIYFVSTKKTNLQVQLSENGTLLSINSKPSNNSSSTNTLSSDMSAQFKTPDKPSNLGNTFTELNIYEKFDTVFKQIKVDTMLMVQKVIKSDMVKKTEAQKAEEMANKIIASKQIRNDLLSGMQEVSYDPKTMTYMNEQLLATENDYLLCFTGYTENLSYTYDFEFIPNQDTLYPIAHFSNQSGIIPLNKEVGNMQTLYLLIEKEVNPNKGIEKFNKQALIQNIPQGFYYRLPQVAKVNICLDKYSLKKSNLAIAQWGKSFYLPAKEVRLNLDPLTGALLSLEYLQAK